MAVRGDDVAGSIDAHVKEAVERMVGEIRSSIEDVRAAVDSQLEAALQSVQADVKSLTFLPHIKKSVGELEESYAAAKPKAPPAPAGGDASRVRTAIQVIEAGKSQVDILNALLEQCLHFGSRAALLILRGETFSGWKGVGFGAHGGNDEVIKRFNAAPGLVPELDTVHVPIGCGSGICGLISVRDALGLTTKIIGVVSSNANAYAQSFRTGRHVETQSADTIADGMAVRVPVDAALEVIRKRAEDVVEVTDDEVESAMRIYYDDTHQVAEGAGAAPLAALLKSPRRAGGRHAVILCGGNVDRAVYHRILGEA